MGYSSSTPHLALPQWQDNDKPSFRGDINAAFGILDEALGNKADKSTIDFYVKDYGAVADGTTNDGAHIQAAIDAAFAVGGGNVHLVRGATCAFDGEINIKTGVTLIGSKFGQTITNYDLKALSHTSTILVGGWANSYSPGGLQNVSIDGNEFGPLASNTALVQLECVDIEFNDILIRNAAGAGLYFNAAQNQVYINLHVDNCARGIVFDNGSGGILFLRAEISNNGIGIQFIDTPDMANGYPFGSANITFVNSIVEWYANSTNPLITCLDMQCGSVIKFMNCGFSNNVPTTPTSANALCKISNVPFPSISTNVEFSSCNWNGAALDVPLRVIGSQIVEVNGLTYTDNQTPQLATPSMSVPTITNSVGAWGAGNKSVQVTAVNSSGETTASTAIPFTTALNDRVALHCSAVPGAASYNFYIQDGATTYVVNSVSNSITLNSEPTTTGVVPTTNTAASPQYFYLQDSGIAGQVSLNFASIITVGLVVLIGAVNGGNTANCYRQFRGLQQHVSNDGSDWPIEGKHITDTGIRWYIDGNGGLHWNSGVDYANLASIIYDLANDQVVYSGTKHLMSNPLTLGNGLTVDSGGITVDSGGITVDAGAVDAEGGLKSNGARTKAISAPIFPSGAVTIDVSQNEIFYFSVSGGSSVTTLTINGEVEGSCLTIMVVSDGNAQTWNWPANFFWPTSTPPQPTAGPAGAYVRSYEFIYDSASAHWFPVSIS
jgi:hypothetical protein